ncbi:MAG: hypothetical protein DDT23_01323 [candidate division WS2 bacterium]|nr:hypothetical protein [Candidatus Lithacetigena glycinireducens]
MDTEKRIFTDTLLTAFLHFKNFSVKPLSNSQKLISFEVSGENLSDVISEFYTNPKIPILAFIQSYKTIRSMIFNLKEGQK